jgi:hypothetical protein
VALIITLAEAEEAIRHKIQEIMAPLDTVAQPLEMVGMQRQTRAAAQVVGKKAEQAVMAEVES